MENKAKNKNQYEMLLGVAPMSDFPDENVNREWDDGWTESKKLCPNCRSVKMWQAGWYDGTPDNGGACIGTQFQCGKCNHHESW